MSRSTIIVVLVVLVALLIFGFTAFIVPGGGEPRQPTETPVAAGGTAAAGGDLVAQGQSLAQQLGCIACHTTNGTVVVGPSWKGLAGSEVTLTDGSTVTADSAYIRESITDPDAKIVEGFSPGIMGPSVEAVRSQIEADNNLDALVAYIESVK